ncbi:MAG TPA: hypothetical protein VEA79_04895 [Phenylobacterium sp.]|nr:hypothetical protein [Phenylobacterium sp.]
MKLLSWCGAFIAVAFHAVACAFEAPVAAFRLAFADAFPSPAPEPEFRAAVASDEAAYAGSQKARVAAFEVRRDARQPLSQPSLASGLVLAI